MIAELTAAKKDLKIAQTIMQLDELKSRKRVLRRYHAVVYVDSMLGGLVGKCCCALY